MTAPALSPAEAIKSAAFGLDDREPMTDEKVKALVLLKQQETLAREGAERIRASYDFAPKPQLIAEALMEEARAGAFRSAVEIVEQVAF